MSCGTAVGLGATLRGTAPNGATSMIVSAIEAPQRISVIVGPAAECALNWSGGQSRLAGQSQLTGALPLKRHRVDVAEQRFHAAVPAELQRVRPGGLAHRIMIAPPGRQDVRGHR